MSRALTATLTLAALFLPGAAAPARTLTYVRRADKDRLTTTIELTKTKRGLLIVKRNAEERFRIECDARGNTLRWEISSKRHKLALKAKRHGSAIYIKGRVDGDAVDKRLDIDGKPWFQDVGFNIRRFILSAQQKMSFWMVHPKKKAAYKMLITTEGRETLTIGGRGVAAIKTKMVIDKFLVSRLWAGYHWHRASDGLFLRYRSKGGMPGTPDVEVVIRSGM